MTEKEFDLYVKKVRPKLVAFAATFALRGAMEVDDVIQEAMIKVWQEKKEVKNYDGFAIVALRNICLDYLRKKRMDGMSGVEVVGDTNPHRSLETSEAIRSVAQILKKLPLDQQMVVRLRDVMGYDFSEIGVILETSEGNVRTLLSRSRKNIREQLIKKEL